MKQERICYNMFVMLMGIYQIQNLVNGKCYVGSSSNLPKREKQHFNKFKNGKHKNVKLKNAIKKYGIENFEFSVLEYVENIDNLVKIEQYYIDAFDAVKNGYNVCLMAGNTLGIKHTEEANRQKSERQKGKYTGDKHPMYGRSGKLNPFYGKNHTEEMKLTLRLNNRNTDKTHCIMGHEFTEENTIFQTRKNGKIYRNCRECRRINDRKRYAIAKKKKMVEYE